MNGLLTLFLLAEAVIAGRVCERSVFLARKSVEVFTENGGSYHVKNSVAHRMVNSGQAVFVNQQLTKVRELPVLLRPKSARGGFSEAWSIRMSAGMGVWQYQP